MAEQNHMSKSRPSRNRPKRIRSAAVGVRGVDGSPDASSPTRIEQAIEAERAQLLQACGVLRCLYEALLYANADNTVLYAEAAHVALRLIDESVERLDSVRLGPMIEELCLNVPPYGVREEFGLMAFGDSGTDEVGLMVWGVPRATVG